MRHAKNLKIGSLVQVPDYCFAPMRSGWNGWLFRAGVIRKIGKSKRDGATVYQVERCIRGYGDPRVKDNRRTITAWFRKDAIFEKGYEHSKMLMEHPREYWCNGCYDEDTEFMIDQGFLTYDPEAYAKETEEE